MLSAETFGEWWAEGRAFPLDQGVALAMSTPLDAGPASETLNRVVQIGNLTPRQLQVVGLLGRGFKNRQIAESLVITERAAAAHVERIMDKLGVGSRTEIAVWAAEHGLLTTPRT